MTDSVLLPGPSRLSTVVAHDKTEAFQRAARHSLRVRRLRVAILLGAVALILAVVIFAFFDPFRASLPANVSIDSAGLNGTTVTMAHPKMSGYRKDGRPYDFTAESAVQNLKTPSVLQLNTLDAHVAMTDGVAHVTADVGVYDTTKEIMDLKGDIHITSQTGADIRMKSAHVEFTGGNVSSQEAVTVSMPTGTVTSDAMHMVGNGADVTFVGHVHSVMQSAGSGPSHATRAGGAASQ